jgi:hypothetical protein
LNRTVFYFWVFGLIARQRLAPRIRYPQSPDLTNPRKTKPNEN